MPHEATVRNWAVDDVQGFSTLYARARNTGLDCIAEGTIGIADDLTEDPNSRRVRIDARKWLLSKMRPDKYGDQVKVSGDPLAPLIPKVIVQLIDSPKPPDA